MKTIIADRKKSRLGQQNGHCDRCEQYKIRIENGLHTTDWGGPKHTRKGECLKKQKDQTETPRENANNQRNSKRTASEIDTQLDEIRQLQIEYNTRHNPQKTKERGDNRKEATKEKNLITDQNKNKIQPQGAKEITKNIEAENKQAKRITDAVAKRSQIERNGMDVPKDHPAWKCLRLEKMDTVAAAVGNNMNGENIRIQVTAMQAKGSINTAARICRLCYARLLQGDSKEETTEHRQQLLRQLPDKPESYQETDKRQMINLRKNK